MGHKDCWRRVLNHQPLSASTSQGITELIQVTAEKVFITYSRMSSTVGVASMRLVVQACSWKGVCIPSRLAAIPLGAKARAHGHSRFTVLVRSHCGAGLSKKKEMQRKNSF